MPTIAKICAIDAMTAPNLAQQPSNIGPMNRDMRNIVKRMAAFQTIGPRDTIPIRTKALGGSVPSGFLKDFTKEYAMTLRWMVNIAGERERNSSLTR